MRHTFKVAIAVAALAVVVLFTYLSYESLNGSSNQGISARESASKPRPQRPLIEKDVVATPATRSILDRSAFDSPSLQIALAGALLIALLALILSAMKKRRESLVQSPHLVTPENFHKWTAQVSDALGAVIKATNNNSLSIRENGSAFEAAFNDLARTFLALQSALDQRDQQLKRAEQGWELQVFRRFLLRFARVDEVLHDQSLDASACLTQSRLMMQDALEECGVAQFLPRLGSDYRNEKGVDDRPVLTHVSESALFYKIKSVVSPGYRVRAANGDDLVVIPARVEVYAPEENINA